MKIRVVAGAVLGAVLVVPSVASAATTPELSGGAVYVSAANQLSRYEDGKWATLAKTGDLPQFSASPDGKKAAWVTSDGRLQIRQGGRTTTIVSALQGGTPCLTPVWSPDSARVAYAGAGNKIMHVRADGTDSPHKLGTSEGVCHLAWSANGRYVAGYTGEADALYRLDTQTGKAVRAKGVKLVTHLQSLSPDGRKAVVEFPQNRDMLGDGGWPTWFKPVVVDMVTGKRVPMAVKGRLLGAFYLADGRLVVRVGGAEHNTLVVLDGAGKELQRIAEPAKARKQALLQVLP
ncbi:TolB family protein [Nonomuraea sp. M3C6]|uniref:TolB family protein n=1 Tax=Nonomuraea marmarensis TaxID=3351344 RepID=A0ABW7ARA3_9ACTN